MYMKKKIKKVIVETPQPPVIVERTFLNNFPIEERRTFTTWVLTLIIFFLILHSANYDLSKASGIWIVLLLGDVLVGGIAFLYLLVNVGSSLFKKETFIRSAMSVGAISVILLSFFGVLTKLPTLTSTTANSQKTGTSSTSSSSLISLPSPVAKPSTSTATPKPTNKVTTNTGSTITCVGPDDKQFVTTMEECKTLNEKWGKPVDYMTTCNYPIECGGQSKYIKKSECDVPCKRTSGTSTTNTYTPTYKATTYTPCIVYYPILGYSQTYNYMTTDACNKAKADANTYTTTPPVITTTTTPPPTSNLMSCNGTSSSGSYTYFGELTFKECCNKLCSEAYILDKRAISSQYGQQSSTYDAIVQSQLEPKYQSCLASCN